MITMLGISQGHRRRGYFFRVVIPFITDQALLKGQMF